MKITGIDAFPIRLPVRRDFKWAGLRENLGGFVITRLTTEDGTIGWGEATPLPDWGGAAGRRGGETQATVISMIRNVLAPVVIGLDVSQTTQARRAMDAAAIGNSYAKTAIDIALHDALGKVLGQPIYKLLGGRVRDSVAYAHMVGLMDEDEALAEALGAVEDGCTALQIKGGPDADRDVRLIAAIRKEAGDGLFLRLDANQGYRTARYGKDTLKRLRDAGADGCEQPVADMRSMIAVTREGTLPVMADESCWDAVDAMDLVMQDAADWISIYLAKAGGFTGARKVAAIAETMNIPCDVNGSIECAIGTAANVHFSLAMPAVTLPGVFPVSAPAGRHPCKIAGNYYTDDILTEPMAIDGGNILPLDAPGLGIEIDEDKLDRYRQDLA